MIRTALWRSVESDIASMEPAVVLPFRPRPRDSIPMLLLSVTVVGAVLIGQLEDRPAPDLSQRVSLNAEQVDGIESDLERLADMLAAEASRDRSQYLHAVSRVAQDLAERIKVGAVDIRIAAREVQTILDYIEAEIGARLSVPAQVDGLSPSGLTVSPPQLPRTGQAETALTEAAANLRAITDALERIQSARVGSEFETINAGAQDAFLGRQNRGSLSAAQGEAGGAAKGVAERSTADEGDAAGHGTQDLYTDDLIGSNEFSKLDEVVLPRDGDGSGGPRVGGLSDAGEQDSTIVSGGTDRSTESVVAANTSQATRARAASVRDEIGSFRSSDMSPDAIRLASVLLEPRSQAE